MSGIAGGPLALWNNATGIVTSVIGAGTAFASHWNKKRQEKRLNENIINGELIKDIAKLRNDYLQIIKTHIRLSIEIINGKIPNESLELYRALSAWRDSIIDLRKKIKSKFPEIEEEQTIMEMTQEQLVSFAQQLQTNWKISRICRKK